MLPLVSAGGNILKIYDLILIVCIVSFWDSFLLNKFKLVSVGSCELWVVVYGGCVCGWREDLVQQNDTRY